MKIKLLIGSLAIAVPLASSSANQVVFSDVPVSTWFTEYVTRAAEMGIVTGYKDIRGNPTGKFGPSDNITLSQIIKIAVVAAGYDTNRFTQEVLPGTPKDAASHWSAPFLRVAHGMDFPFMHVNSGLDFNLDQKVTRGEVVMIFNDVFSSDLIADGLLSGDIDSSGKLTGNLRLGDLINRAEVTKIVLLAKEKYGEIGKNTKSRPNFPSIHTIASHTKGILFLGFPKRDQQSGVFPLFVLTSSGKLEDAGKLPLEDIYPYFAQYFDGKVYYKDETGKLVARDIKTGEETVMFLPHTEAKKEHYEKTGLNTFIIGANGKVVYSQGTCTNDGARWNCEIYIYDLKTKADKYLGSIESPGMFGLGGDFDPIQNEQSFIWVRAGAGDGSGSSEQINIVDVNNLTMQKHTSTDCYQGDCKVQYEEGGGNFPRTNSITCNGITLQRDQNNDLVATTFGGLVKIASNYYVGCLE